MFSCLLVLFLSRNAEKSICERVTAQNTIAQPIYSLGLILSPRKIAPPSTANADSSESMTEATAGFAFLCPTICKV